MFFMVLMYSDPDRTRAMTPEERQFIAAKHEALHANSAQALRNGAGLSYPSDTTTLRLENDEPVAGKGPLLAGTEQLTAYYVVECDSMAQAQALAEGILDFHVTAVEVRQIHDMFGF
jgi:hypothetical protein